MANWKFEWIDRVDLVGAALDGQPPNTSTVVDLTAPPFNVAFASFMGDAPPMTPINQYVPMQPGSYLKYFDTDNNEVELVLFIKGKNRQDLYDIINGKNTQMSDGTWVSLPELFNPLKEPVWCTLNNPGASASSERFLTGFGKLRVTTPAMHPVGNGQYEPVVRELICRCSSGFKIRNSDLFVNYAYCPLVFYANQPYWRKTTRNVMELGTQSQRNNPGNRSFPSWFTVVNTPTPAFDQVTLGSQAPYQKKFQILNTGDVSTPPIFTVRGPGAGPVFILQGIKTGPGLTPPTKVCAFDRSLVIGRRQDLVVDFENRTAIISRGPDETRKIQVSSEFWELPVGKSTLQVRVRNGIGNNPVTVNRYTRCKIEFHERFLGVY
ncbi:MAG: hypothetical protein VX772_01820 [Bacteroidota bacterium]|nr:hypothetical protein [Bacteroidota bacterium]